MAAAIERIRVPPRPDWRAKAEAAGFNFHSPGGTTYWREDVAYRLDLAATEAQIEEAANGLHGLLMQAVDRILGDDALLDRFLIPREFFKPLRASWREGQRDLYTRLDFAWTGVGPAKLLEVNGDTPTALFEAAVFQWMWLEEGRAHDIFGGAKVDQLNSLHERLVMAFGQMGIAPAPLHLTCVRDHAEDLGTVAYLRECADEAGLETVQLFIDEIGIDAKGRFVDGDDRVISRLFKLYPWEDLLREEFAVHIERSGCRFIEPPWKMLLSAKAILPVLWEMFEGHPNLLPAFFEDDPKAASLGADVVRKPLFGREGQGVQRITGGQVVASKGSERYGPEGYVVQQATELASFPDGDARVWTVLGAWIVAGECCGVGIREDRDPITGDNAQFVPHFLAG